MELIKRVLKDKQLEIFNGLRDTIEKIEKIMREPIDSDQPDVVEKQLADRIVWLGYTSKIMEQATVIYDWAKGIAAVTCLSSVPGFEDLKMDLQILKSGNRTQTGYGCDALC